MTRAELYLKKAEDFAARAAEAEHTEAKASYEKLAQSYRHLASHVSRSYAQDDEEMEASAKRIAGK